MFENFKRNRKVNKSVADSLGKAIEEKTESGNADPKELFELWQNRETVKRNNVSMDTVMKIAGNVVIVLAIMAFETRYVINRNATKFINPLK